MKEKGKAKSYVLDSSAILELWNDEDGAETVEKILRSGLKVYASLLYCISGQNTLF